MRLRRSIGPYELLRVLDTGGMGRVYLARERRRGQPAREVVVKTIRSELERAPEHITAFERETRILARLQHPNIVRLYDAGRAGTRLFMVMEYLDGLDVTKLLRLLASSGRKLPPGLVARVGIEAARALHAAHAYTTDSGKLAGLVHRDLSPHNVFVLYDGRVKLLDFGLARAYGESASTDLGMVKGKFRYLAPEQARGEELDGRVDIFTLGLVLHEMITGRRAYDQTGDVEVLRAAMAGQFVRLSALAPKTPAPLLRVIERAVQSSRDERYPSAAAMADDLTQAAAELGLATGLEAQREFLNELRALAEASPPANHVEPSGRLSADVRSSLTSVTDIDLDAADVGARPRPGPRLGLWAGGLGAAVGAIAAVINLVGSRPAPTAPITSAEEPASALAPAEPAQTAAPDEPAPATAERAPNDHAAEVAPPAAAPAAALPAAPERVAEPGPAPSGHVVAPSGHAAAPSGHAIASPGHAVAPPKAAGNARPVRRPMKRLPPGISQDRR